MYDKMITVIFIITCVMFLWGRKKSLWMYHAASSA